MFSVTGQHKMDEDTIIHYNQKAPAAVNPLELFFIFFEAVASVERHFLIRETLCLNSTTLCRAWCSIETTELVIFIWPIPLGQSKYQHPFAVRVTDSKQIKFQPGYKVKLIWLSHESWKRDFFGIPKDYMLMQTVQDAFRTRKTIAIVLMFHNCIVAMRTKQGLQCHVAVFVLRKILQVVSNNSSVVAKVRPFLSHFEQWDSLFPVVVERRQCQWCLWKCICNE